MRSLLRCHSASPRPSTLRISSAFLNAPCAPRYSTIFSATFLPTPVSIMRSFTDAVLMFTLPPTGAEAVIGSVRVTVAASAGAISNVTATGTNASGAIMEHLLKLGVSGTLDIAERRHFTAPHRTRSMSNVSYSAVAGLQRLRQERHTPRGGAARESAGYQAVSVRHRWHPPC